MPLKFPYHQHHTTTTITRFSSPTCYGKEPLPDKWHRLLWARHLSHHTKTVLRGYATVFHETDEKVVSSCLQHNNRNRFTAFAGTAQGEPVQL